MRSNQVVPAPLTSVVVGSSGNGFIRQAGPMSEGAVSPPGTAPAAAPGSMTSANMQSRHGTPYDLAGSNPRSSVSQYVAASAAPYPPAAAGLPDEDPDAPTLKPSADGTLDFNQLVPGNFIPFRYPVVRDMIVDSHPEVFRDAETRKKFHKFCQW
jgi:hypothetical protein